MRIIYRRESMPNTMLMIVFVMILGCIVQGHEIALECKPMSEVNFSSHVASVAIYDITSSSKTIGTNAAIFCTIDGKSNQYVEMELAMYGEPPKLLALVAEFSTLSRLDGLSISCSADDIINMNRVRPDEDLRFYKNKTGTVEYKCVGQKEITIVLEGLQLLKEDLSHNRYRKDISPICTITNRKIKKYHKKLGTSCGCASRSCRFMFDSSGNAVCSLCCPDHHWSTKELTCLECPICTTMESAHPFTKCMPIPDCVRPTPNMPSSSTGELEQQSTFGTQASEETLSTPSIVEETSETTVEFTTAEKVITDSNEKTTTPSENVEDEKIIDVATEINIDFLGRVFMIIIAGMGTVILLIGAAFRNIPDHGI